MNLASRRNYSAPVKKRFYTLTIWSNVDFLNSIFNAQLYVPPEKKRYLKLFFIWSNTDYVNYIYKMPSIGAYLQRFRKLSSIKKSCSWPLFSSCILLAPLKTLIRNLHFIIEVDFIFKAQFYYTIPHRCADCENSIFKDKCLAPGKVYSAIYTTSMLRRLPKLHFHGLYVIYILYGACSKRCSKTNFHMEAVQFAWTPFLRRNYVAPEKTWLSNLYYFKVVK